MAEEEYGRAVAELDAALNLARGDCYDLLYLMAQAKYRLGRYGEARLAAEHAAAYRPQAADVHYLLGRHWRKQGRLEAAAAHFRTATLAEEHEPENPRVTAAWHELGECLGERGYLRAAGEASSTRSCGVGGATRASAGGGDCRHPGPPALRGYRTPAGAARTPRQA